MKFLDRVFKRQYWPQHSHENWLVWGGPASYRAQIDGTKLTIAEAQTSFVEAKVGGSRQSPLPPPPSPTHKDRIKRASRTTKKKIEATQRFANALTHEPEDTMITVIDKLHFTVDRFGNRYREAQKLHDSLIFL